MTTIVLWKLKLSSNNDFPRIVCIRALWSRLHLLSMANPRILASLQVVELADAPEKNFFFFFPGLSRHLWSPVQLISFFLHDLLFWTVFVALSYYNPASVISLLHASFHLRFGRPLLLFPGTCMSTSSILLTMCSSFILLTWPYHFSRFCAIFLDACTTLVPLMCSFWILSLNVTPHIHLSILISFTSSRASCPLVVAQVSAPYNRAGLTTVL